MKIPPPSPPNAVEVPEPLPVRLLSTELLLSVTEPIQVAAIAPPVPANCEPVPVALPVRRESLTVSDPSYTAIAPPSLPRVKLPMRVGVRPLVSVTPVSVRATGPKAFPRTSKIRSI